MCPLKRLFVYWSQTVTMKAACFITWRNTHQGLVHFQRHNDVDVISQWYRHLFKYATVECHSSRCIIRREVTLLKHQFVRWCRSTFAWVHCILLQKRKHNILSRLQIISTYTFSRQLRPYFFQAAFFFFFLPDPGLWCVQGYNPMRIQKKESAYFGKSSPHFAVNRLLKGEI